MLANNISAYSTQGQQPSTAYPNQQFTIQKISNRIGPNISKQAPPQQQPTQTSRADQHRNPNSDDEATVRSDSDGEENHRLGKNPTVVSNKTASEGKGSSATYHSHHSSNSGSVASIQNSAGGSSKTHNSHQTSHTQHYTGRSKVAGPSTNLSQ